MKPLELKTYPLAYPERDPDCYQMDSGMSVYGPAVLAMKQLTDAQLAAEYWFMDAVTADQAARASHGDVKPIDVLMAQSDLKTIERFATLPHASETNYE